MSRSLELEKASNPSVKFLEWKSNDKKLQFYNKQTAKNEFIELPFKFMKLTEFHTIKGFHDGSQSGIFSNEVKYIGKEELNVRSFKGGDIAKGLYKTIKGDIISAGGHYAKSIYIMTADFQIWNIQMKGSVVGAWSEFSNEMRKRLNDEWIEIKTFEEKTKGATNYTVPVFSSERTLSDEEWEKAKENFEVLNEFFKERGGFQEHENNEPPIESYEQDFVPDTNQNSPSEQDDMPF